jgi:serine protease Do
MFRKASLFLLLLAFSVFAISSCKKTASVEIPDIPATRAQNTAPAPVLADGSRTSYADVVDRVAPAVVKVSIEHKVKAPSQQFPFSGDPSLRDFFKGMPGQGGQEQRPQIERGLGSGVIVSADGTILTNHHVIDGADRIKVEMNDNKTYDAKVVGSDPPSDLAVLKIDAQNLPYLTLGDSDKVRVGDIVLAIGNPLGIGQTVTAGIISAKGRRTGLSDGSFEDFLQTDAPINRGNSGGALVNLNGELVGINSQILSPGGAAGGNIGIGFSIPSNMSKSVMEQLLKDGKVHRGQLGVVIQNITEDLAKSLSLQDTRGVIVSEVKSGSAADKAGVKRGDVITAINGDKIEDSNTLRNKVAGTTPGSEITLTILRNGSQQDIKTKLDEFNSESVKRGAPDEESDGNGDKSSDNGKLGLELQPLSPDLAKRLQVPADSHGMVVTDVDPQGPGAEAGMQQGDVIIEINKQQVSTYDDVKSAIDKAGDRTILLLVARKGQTVFVPIQPAPSN